MDEAKLNELRELLAGDRIGTPAAVKSSCGLLNVHRRLGQQFQFNWGEALEYVSSGHSASQNGPVLSWLTTVEERGKCLETQITPFRLPIGNRKG